jgi:hypothetical protein
MLIKTHYSGGGGGGVIAWGIRGGGGGGRCLRMLKQWGEHASENFIFENVLKPFLLAKKMCIRL